MDGTWGLCLKDITAENLLRKEFARQVIARHAGASQLTPEARGELLDAVADYQAVAACFGPHEVGASSRRLEVEAVIARFGLDDPEPLRRVS